MRILIVSIILFLSSGCSKSENEFENEFEKSYKTWLTFKENSKDNYSFTTESNSWIGTTAQTKVVVKNGEIVEQEFKMTRILNHSIPNTGWTRKTAIQALQEMNDRPQDHYNNLSDEEVLVLVQWHETKENLGKHNNRASLMTLDQIYDKSKNDWLSKRKDTKIYFEAKNNGLISQSGYVPNNCQDDCFTGVNIIKIEKLED